MITYILRRLAYMVPTLLLASILLFVFVSATTDPLARLRVGLADPGAIEREEKRLGLDQPIPVQYVNWLGDFVRGDWGESYITRQTVTSEIFPALWNTTQLIFAAVLLSAFVSITVGVYTAWRQYSKLDYTLTGIAFLGVAAPPQFIGLLAIHYGSYELSRLLGASDPVFFSVGMASATPQPLDYPRHLFLPMAVLSVQLIAQWSRYQRAAMLDVKNADYIRTARAKGVPRRTIIFKHALRNALIPLTTAMAVDIGGLFGGLIVTEQIFSWPGMGRLLVESVLQGDIPILLPWMVVTALFIIVANLIADLLYGVLDPRIRLA
jgi:peptide/nickel transport system permease protein